MPVGSVNRLLKVEAGIGLSWRDNACSRVDRVGERLVEEPGLQNAVRVEVVFNQNVVVIGPRRLQCRVPNHHGRRSEVWIYLCGGYDVREIGPGDAHSERSAKFCILLNPILQLNAGQEVDVTSTACDWNRGNPCSIAEIDLIGSVGIAG